MRQARTTGVAPAVVGLREDDDCPTDRRTFGSYPVPGQDSKRLALLAEQSGRVMLLTHAPSLAASGPLHTLTDVSSRSVSQAAARPTGRRFPFIGRPTRVCH